MGQQVNATNTVSNKCTDFIKTGAKWTAIAAVVTAIVIGVVGLFVHLNYLQINVGAITSTTGLYLMVSGFSVATIIALALATRACSKETKVLPGRTPTRS